MCLYAKIIYFYGFFRIYISGTRVWRVSLRSLRRTQGSRPFSCMRRYSTSAQVQFRGYRSSRPLCRPQRLQPVQKRPLSVCRLDSQLDSIRISDLMSRLCDFCLNEFSLIEMRYSYLDNELLYFMFIFVLSHIR